MGFIAAERRIGWSFVYVSPEQRYKDFVGLEADIRALVPGMRLSNTEIDRRLYGRDLWPRELIVLRSGHGERRPALVVWPEDEQSVERLVAFANTRGVPLVPYGAGSGVCGAIAPASEAVVVDLKKLTERRIAPDRGSIEVGAGMLGITLEQELEKQGLTVGHFPSSILCSTVGGWVAARGAGQCSTRYGKIEDMVTGVDCVLGGGERIRARYRAQGPNLLPLLVGSEGTLGVITKVHLRLHPAPPHRAFASYSFRSIEQGFETLRELCQQGLRPAVARLYDPLDTTLMAPSDEGSEGGKHKKRLMYEVTKVALRIPRAVNQVVRALEGNLLGRCLLVLVFEGTQEQNEQDCMRVQAIARRFGGRSHGEGPARAWMKHRYAVSYRQSPIFRMGAFSDTMEVAAPWSRLSRVYDDVRAAIGEHALVLAHLSHAYPDGCSIYFTFSAAPGDDAKALSLYDRLWKDALGAALAAGATLSHHHGVGRSKAPQLGAELGHGLTMIRQVMKAWDPGGIMNPGALADRSERFDAASNSVPALSVDRESLLAHVAADQSLQEVERLLRRDGLTLGIEPVLELGVAEWVRAGFPGRRDSFDDPVDHGLAGLSARIDNGAHYQFHPSPRRAVGPDVSTLVMRDPRVGSLKTAWLRVERVASTRPRILACPIDRQPPASESEKQAWESAVAAVTSGLET